MLTYILGGLNAPSLGRPLAFLDNVGPVELELVFDDDGGFGASMPAMRLRFESCRCCLSSFLACFLAAFSCILLALPASLLRKAHALTLCSWNKRPSQLSVKKPADRVARVFMPLVMDLLAKPSACKTWSPLRTAA
jgi:hypothetical protein